MSDVILEPWLTIIGIGDNGLKSLTPEAQSLVWQAETLVLGERLDAVIDGSRLPDLKRILNWSGGFRDTLAEVLKLRGTPVTVLATGDPMHYGIGATLLRYVPAEEIRVLPSPSAFSLAASRLGWPLQSVTCISLHGRPLAKLNRHLMPRHRIMALTSGTETVIGAAALMVKRDFGNSLLTVLEHMGGDDERVTTMTASDLLAEQPEFSAFNTLAIDCVSDSPLVSPIAGLPDDDFVHDGQITKREVRAVTLSFLQPFPEALLWDVGAGCGTVALEFMRIGHGARAIAIEDKPERVSMIRENAEKLGFPDLDIVEGRAPHALERLETPDVIFIGGGITGDGVFDACWRALPPGGRIVANAVTVEGEARLAQLQSEFGGELTRLTVSRAEPVGRYLGWKGLMPVTIWWTMKGNG
ncbi:precorrin-6y C5,15-methyltransferase (decarboxylating) subunit CbiE [Agrobacterium sp. ES01]|uniref:precorrin-6y C5,15-methyltransferase (decarboxylating) subunit CbiE n=1 Tax=Agrobacterium sp. ES01 TaxID=3420714 RepID=UPI003D0F7564